MRHSRVRRVGALLVGLAFVAASCGSDEEESGSTGTAAAPVTTVAAATTEAAADTTEAAADTTEAAADTTEAAADTTEAAADTTEAAADTTEGESDTTAAAGGDDSALAGMKGTTPLVELSEDFKERLNNTEAAAATPLNETYNYAAETYDAIVLIALAAEQAGTDGSAMANEIVDLTKDGEKCTDFVSCMEIVTAGGDVDYDGFSGPITMNGNGEPLEASYGVLTFGEGNVIDDELTTYVTASAPKSAELPLATAEVEREGDNVLKIGSILPETGSLAFLAPPEFAAAELAVNDINEAGGVLGNPVEFFPGDSGDTSTDTASQTVDRLLGEDVDAIIGAASSSVSLTVIDKITAAGVIQFSPANTSLTLVDYPDKGLYFRNAPPDDLQGNVVAQLVADDGNSSAYILALDDAYGTSLATVVEEGLTAAGVEVLGVKIYDPKATGFDAEVDEIVAADPDAVVLITFDEGSRVLKTMVEKGVGPQDKAVYGVDGNMGNALGENFNAGK
jgi:ABC-type branched-subunit amino acid transport system substrate-binding protein